jgi:hypothetical protein
MTDMIRILIALVALALALASPAMAQSPKTNAPPGNSAIDEYLETIPGAGGDSHPGSQGGDGGQHTDAAQQKLARMGPDGRALARLVAATAPARAGTDRTHRGSDQSGPSDRSVALSLSGARAGSPVGAALAAAVGRDDGGGLGLLLPAILLGSLAGVIMAVVLRRRPRAS